MAGNLRGINGLAVAGQNYNVSFQDGSCSTVYGGCTPSTNSVVFTTHTLADAATTALYYMLGEGISGRINGCSTAACLIMTPHAADANDVFVSQLNIEACTGSCVGGNYSATRADYDDPYATDTGASMRNTFAVWTAASTAAAPSANNVPEPGSLVLAAVGLGAAFMACGTSRRRATTKVWTRSEPQPALRRRLAQLAGNSRLSFDFQRAGIPFEWACIGNSNLITGGRNTLLAPDAVDTLNTGHSMPTDHGKHHPPHHPPRPPPRPHPTRHQHPLS